MPSDNRIANLEIQRQKKVLDLLRDRNVLLKEQNSILSAIHRTLRERLPQAEVPTENTEK